MGNDKLFMPKFGLVEAYIWGLRCFESPSEAYHLVPYPCDTIYSTISTTNAPNEADDIEISPNPFHEAIYLRTVTLSEPYTFLLYSNTGHLVRRQKFSGSAEIETESLPAGIYFWSIEKGGAMVKRGKCVKE